MFVILAALVCLSFKSTDDQAIRWGLQDWNLKREKGKVKVCVYLVPIEPYCGSQASYAFVDANGILSA